MFTCPRVFASLATRPCSGSAPTLTLRAAALCPDTHVSVPRVRPHRQRQLVVAKHTQGLATQGLDGQETAPAAPAPGRALRSRDLLTPPSSPSPPGPTCCPPAISPAHPHLGVDGFAGAGAGAGAGASAGSGVCASSGPAESPPCEGRPAGARTQANNTLTHSRTHARAFVCPHVCAHAQARACMHASPNANALNADRPSAGPFSPLISTYHEGAW